MQYRAPLNVDLPQEIRGQIYKQRRVNGQVQHAKWAARQIANRFIVHHDATLVDDSACHAQLSQYLVPKAAWDYATQYARAYAKQRLEAKNA